LYFGGLRRFMRTERVLEVGARTGQSGGEAIIFVGIDGLDVIR
jgi:hypothetical protein